MTETLFAADAGPSVVGVTSYCDYPTATASITKVGDILTPNIEIIASLKPDLVFLTVEGNTRASFQRLEELGFKIFVSNPTDFAGIGKTMTDMGTIFRQQDRTKRLLDSLNVLIDTTNQPMPALRPTVLMVLSTQPLIAAGGQSFIQEIIVRAGGLNAVSVPDPYPVFNREEIVRRNPDIILLPLEMMATTGNLLNAFPEWKSIAAIKHKHVYPIDADIFLRPGPRAYQSVGILRELIAKWEKRRVR